MIETLLGGLLGGTFRLMPELMKWLDRRGERSHELAMQDKALEFEKLRGAQRMTEIGATAEAAWHLSALETLRESIHAQGEKSGVKWADALSISVRPTITYWYMLLYSAGKASIFMLTWRADVDWAVAVLQCWTDADQALFAGIMNFWFLGRVFEKARA